MFDHGIREVHIEPTARCNAKCPMCSRTGRKTILDDQGELTLADFKKYFPPHLLKDIEQWKFCGNFGDPILCKDLIPIHEYILEHSHSPVFILSTNAGVRSTNWWAKLGEIYKRADPTSYVQFHIDGLEDTNHIYRVGVKWDKVMANAKAYLATGAHAAWVFIPFFHNEYQVDEAEQLSKEMGFDEFVVKISARFPDFKSGFFANGSQLFPPIDPRFDIIDMQVKGELVCFAEVRKEIYVDAWGNFFPCCWTASAAKTNSPRGWPMTSDPTINSLNHRTLEEIITDPVMNEWIEKMYADKKSTCNQRCTGHRQHVIEMGGVQTPQKELWGVSRRVIPIAPA